EVDRRRQLLDPADLEDGKIVLDVAGEHDRRRRLLLGRSAPENGTDGRRERTRSRSDDVMIGDKVARLAVDLDEEARSGGRQPPGVDPDKDGGAFQLVERSQR